MFSNKDGKFLMVTKCKECANTVRPPEELDEKTFSDLVIKDDWLYKRIETPKGHYESVELRPNARVTLCLLCKQGLEFN